jgi:hypothetical protein
MRIALLVAVAVLAGAAPARAFVPPAVDHGCPRSALHGDWVAYAHTLDGAELLAADRLRSTPGRLELSLVVAKVGSKASQRILYEVERPPSACIARTARYLVFGMTWDLELTSNDDLTLRAAHPERGTHVIRLRREVH